MRAAVRQAWIAFTDPLEGTVAHLYTDVLGLVTVAIGNLVDPIQHALGLPFVLKRTGEPARRHEIASDWHRVKALNCWAVDGVRDGIADPLECPWRGVRTCLAHDGHRAAARFTELELTQDDIRRVVFAKLDANDARLAQRFADFESLSADAQLGTHSLAWAAGANFDFPRFAAALRARDFSSCAEEARLKNKGGTIATRNKHQRTLFGNAAIVAARGLDPDVLYWPRNLLAEAEAETLPRLADDDQEEEVTREYPPASWERVHPAVPLDRPALDGELPPPSSGSGA